MYANMFITYSFGDNTISKQFYANEREYEFSLGYIYRTSVPNFIKDENGTRHPIEKVSEYLKPYNFELDEDAIRLIKNKKAKGDKVILSPLKLHEDGRITYECECSTTDKKGILCKNFVVLTMSQAEVITECYRILRKRDKRTSFWREFFTREIREYNRKKKMGLI